uniref:Interferon regulatory factor 6 n=1 Tax=Branchiostoma belcheri tsingtauense TaxID=155462 RepID=A0A0A7P6R3_BRABE|nr:interferon regulatory factor 6 [Branchiostoma belcheri tsingtauense]
MAGPSRQQLPDFLLGRIGHPEYPGLVWQGPRGTVFSLPWPRFDGDNPDLNRDATLFKLLQEWETNQGRSVTPPNPTKWKARLRNAIARSREIEEVSDETHSGQPCKLYRFTGHAPLPTILVSVFYRGVQVTSQHLATDCWVHYPPVEQQDVMQARPPDVALLPLPDAPDAAVNQVLFNFKQGIFLYVSSAGCVYAVRRCAARVYWRSPHVPDVEHVLERDNATILLDCDDMMVGQTLRVDLSVGQSFRNQCQDVPSRLVVVVVTVTR